jgi:NAD/NADP transhydrogenase beta subunit
MGFLAAVLFGLSTHAQVREMPEMADVMRSNGKIYVVVVIAALVFLGIVIYLIKLDRKIRKFEKEEV